MSVLTMAESGVANPAAEWSVLAIMLLRPECIGEVVGVPLEQQDFNSPDTRMLFKTIIEMNFGGETVDPLVVADRNRDELAHHWNCDPAYVGDLLAQRTRDSMVTGNVLEHAELVRKASLSRQLQDACYKALADIGEGRLSPGEIGDALSTRALNTVAESAKRSELLTWMDVGREYARHLQRLMEARKQGIEIGVYTGLPFVDNYTVGIGAGELCFIGGDPGSGKSALAWAAALGFGGKQLAKAEDKRVGALVLSMEMGLVGSTMRMVQPLTSIPGRRLRDGSVGDAEYQRFLREWKNRENLPIYWNFASNFRLSQMRALISEAVRKYNVGFVIIDHFRMLDTDRRLTGNEADEERVRFLKENVAKDMDIAVMCLAHTIKVTGVEAGRKPRMSDLRGSGMIAAFADQIGLLWRPSAAMSEEAREEMGETDAEIIWEKNRWGSRATAEFSFYGDTMRVTARDY